jgi:hypothetical protein
MRARHGGRLQLRITLESPRAADHDAIRGRGTFAQTVETIVQLAGMGFALIITAERPFLGDQSEDEIRESYQALFRERGIEVEVNLIENVLEMGHQLAALATQGRQPHAETFVTTNCFSILNKAPESLMCHFSRCIQKIGSAIRYYPCPVIYDDARFELGGTLAESFRRVYVAHKNCYDGCVASTVIRTKWMFVVLPKWLIGGPSSVLAKSGESLKTVDATHPSISINPGRHVPRRVCQSDFSNRDLRCRPRS